MELLENFVGGNRVAVEAEEKLEVPDPATGELLGEVPLSSTSDVDRAVGAAHEAFKE
jgi:malonate-semialdehyde dehydrogenase (acetylating) / methylmalonate-semialdehyde dehydrogenase